MGEAKQKNAGLDRNKIIEIVNNAMQPFIKNVQQGFQQLQQGPLMDLSRKSVASWNLFHVFVRLLEQTGIEQGWWPDRDTFIAKIEAIKEELHKEATEYEKKELERIKAEQAVGNIADPMPPQNNLINRALRAIEIKPEQPS